MTNIDQIFRKKSKVLLIEDDQFLASEFIKQAEPFAYIDHANSFNKALEAIKNSNYDIAFIDLNLVPNRKETLNEGLKLIEPVLRAGIVPIVLSSIDNPIIKRRAVDLGAAHYFVKHKIISDFVGHLKSLILAADRERMNQFFSTVFKTTDFNIVDRFKAIVRGGLNFEDHIILKGPSGVGKSLLAKGIHLFCGYSEKDFKHISVADFKPELVESELFGHKKGSFSGADQDRVGLLEENNEKTVFIDEIDLLPKAVQQKLLVFLSHGTFSRVGDSKTLRSKIRLITATNQNLEEMIAKNSFRNDFYYRINKRELTIPPLSQRRGDVEILLNDLLKQSSPEIVLDEGAYHHLVNNYDYSGNVRELQSILNRLKTIEGKVTLDKLPHEVFATKTKNKSSIRITKSMKDLIARTGKLKDLTEYIEEEIIKETLENYDNKSTPAREALGLSYNKMQAIMKRIDLKANEGGLNYV